MRIPEVRSQRSEDGWMDGWMIRMNNVMEEGKIGPAAVGGYGIRNWACGMRNEKEWKVGSYGIRNWECGMRNEKEWKVGR